MARWRLTAPAAADLREIARYTITAWSVDQAERYIDSIYECLDDVVEFPRRGRELPDQVSGVRALPCGSHVVHYRLRSEDVEVLRIIHARSDRSKSASEN